MKKNKPIIETKKNTNKLKKTVTSILELPKEIVLNLPLITLTGNEELYIENYKGIIEYTEGKIRLNTACGILKIEGRNLFLREITAENIAVTGTLTKLEYLV